jgi:hypothetical protein
MNIAYLRGFMDKCADRNMPPASVLSPKPITNPVVKPAVKPTIHTRPSSVASNTIAPTVGRIGAASVNLAMKIPAVGSAVASAAPVAAEFAGPAAAVAPYVGPLASFMGDMSSSNGPLRSRLSSAGTSAFNEFVDSSNAIPGSGYLRDAASRIGDLTSNW